MLLSNTKAAALLAISTAVSLVNGLGQQPIIAFKNDSDTFQIAGGAISTGQILVSSNDYWGVIRAAGDLALDFGRVTGTNYTLSNGLNASAPAAYVYNPINNKNNTVVSVYPTFRVRNGLGDVLTPHSIRLPEHQTSPALHTPMPHRPTLLSSPAPLATPPSLTT